MLSFFKRVFGDGNDAKIKAFLPVVAEINAFEPSVKALSNEPLSARTVYLKGELSGGRTLDEILPEAFAVVREAARRTLGQRHFDVQLSGGIILHKGNIAEMRTGEGKTLVATLPAYLFLDCPSASSITKVLFFMTQSIPSMTTSETKLVRLKFFMSFCVHALAGKLMRRILLMAPTMNSVLTTSAIISPMTNGNCAKGISISPSLTRWIQF